MERISSIFFMLALLLYYVPKVFRVKKSKYLKLHIGVGSISVVAMIIALIQRIGQADFIKYIGFVTIMILIGLTGYLMKKNPKLYRILHIVFTLSFFIYLYATIAIFKKI